MIERDFSEIFHINYLVSVGCGLQFLPHLEIDNEIYSFQKAIRNEFPLLDIFVGTPIPKIESFGIESVLSPLSEVKHWNFVSQDRKKAVKVTIDKISIVVTNYSEFKEFYGLVSKLFKMFQDTFSIEKFIRVGLRFTNNIVFDQEESKDPSKSIKRLFKPLINNERLTNYDFFKINSEFRWKKENNNVTVKNNYYIDKEGYFHYVIDIDSYTEDLITFDKIEDVLVKLNNISVSEFYGNITNEFIEDLRRKNLDESKP